MRYLISVIDMNTGTADAGEMAAINAFNNKLRAAGYWVLADGLTAPGEAVVIDNRHGQMMMHNGPLHVADDYIAGLWIVEVPDPETARMLAAEGSQACNRRVELRPFL